MAIHVLIAYDGSDGAGAAISAVSRLFPGARASVLHVADVLAAQEQAALARVAVPNESLVAAARSQEQMSVRRARERAEHGSRLAERAGLHAEAELWPGSSAWREILAAARTLDVDVIASGSRGRGKLSRTLLGSTSSALLHHADRPVLIVPPGQADAHGPLLIAYDGSDGARATLAAVARLLPGHEAAVAHAWNSPLQRSFAGEELAAMPLPEGNDLTDQLADELAAQGADVAREGAERARAAGLSARPLPVEASAGAWRALIAAARGERAAAIVAGSRGRGAMRSTVLGSVSAALAHHADRPVLIVR